MAGRISRPVRHRHHRRRPTSPRPLPLIHAPHTPAAACPLMKTLSMGLHMWNPFSCLPLSHHTSTAMAATNHAHTLLELLLNSHFFHSGNQHCTIWPLPTAPHSRPPPQPLLCINASSSAAGAGPALPPPAFCSPQSLPLPIYIETCPNSTAGAFVIQACESAHGCTREGS